MIDQYPPANGVLTSLIWRKTAAGGETSLSGYDNASQALSYTAGQEQVYLNGILLVRGDDYTATNGTSITGLAALSASDFVQINCYNNFSVATLPTSGLTGTIANNQLQNSSITINGNAVSLGGSVSLPGDIESVTATSPLTGGGSTGALTVGIQEASTSQRGSVQLSDSTSTTSSVLAATPTAVKSAYDLANGAIPKTLTTTTGDIIYASSANTPARLPIGSTDQVLKVSGGVPVWSAPAASSASFVGCILANSTNQTINNNTSTAITWNTETADTDGFHSTSSNTSRITIPSGKAGKYVIYLSAGGDTYHSSPAGQTQINLYKNGAQIQSRAEKNETNFNTNIAYSYVLDAAVGDYYEMYIFQNTGINRLFYTDSAQFAIQYLGA